MNLNIPFHFTFGNNFQALSSGDVISLARLYYVYAKATAENLLLHLTETFMWAKQQAYSKFEL